MSKQKMIENKHVHTFPQHMLNNSVIDVACEREGIHGEHKSKQTERKQKNKTKSCQPESSAQVVECVK
jgi:hypothetical protein